MRDEETNGGIRTGAPGNPVVRRITPNPNDSEYEFLELIAELENTEIDELPSLYDEIEHLIETIFKNPPAPRAQLEISFSYAGYRVRMDQRGTVELLNVKQSAPEE